MLLNVSHKVEFIHDKVVIIVLNIVVIAQNILWNSQLQTNAQQAIVHEFAEFVVNPRCIRYCRAESIAQVEKYHFNEVVVKALLIFVKMLFVRQLLVKFIAFEFR